MGWHSHGPEQIFSTPWFSLNRADLELPDDGRRIDHYVVRMPPVAAVAVLDRDDQDTQRVLMLWRHRFMPDTYGWELPAGIVDPAAAFEAERIDWIALSQVRS